jgi:tetratricopeptide (TPR) repeat protein
VQRGPLHAAYARALERRIEQREAPGRPGAGAVERGQLAYHWYAAHDLGQALVASVQAGQAAESASALAEALGHYERALELWDQVPEAAARSPLDRGTVLHRAAEAANLAGDDERSIALGRLALDRVDAAAEPRRAGALLERLARYHWTAAHTPLAMAAVERAVAIIPPEPPSEELARALAAHGQLLMLLDHTAEALARGQEAVAVARQVGARAVEGHALTTLGTSLGLLGHMEEGIADLEEGRRIAIELVNVDDLGRVHACLATVLDMAGRSADAVEVFLAGADMVRQFGALGRYGPSLLPDAANSLLSLGRREEAERLLDQVFDLDLRSPGLRVRPLTVRGTLRVRTGDLAGGRADLQTVLDEVPARPDPQNATPVLVGLAEAALWDGRLEDARAAVADALELLAGSDEPYWPTELCRTGMAVAATLAEQARDRHTEAEERAARELADTLLERARAAVTAPGVVPTRPCRQACAPSRPSGRGPPGRATPTRGRRAPGPGRRSATPGRPATPAGGRPRRCWQRGRPARRRPRPWPGRGPWPTGWGRGCWPPRSRRWPAGPGSSRRSPRTAPRPTARPGAGDGDRRARPHPPGAGGARPGRRRTHQPPDRRGPVHQRQDGQRARVQHPGQAEGDQPRRGRRRRPPAPPHRLSGPARRGSDGRPGGRGPTSTARLVTATRIRGW